MTLQDADFYHPLARQTVIQPERGYPDRLRYVQAIFFVSLGLFATVAWIALLGWCLFQAVLVFWLG